MIRRLGEDDAVAFAALRRAALLDTPLAFAASPEDDVVSSIGAVRAQLRAAPESVIFGAFDRAQLIGAVGLYRDRHRKAAHKAHVWGMYVAPDHRRSGVGAALLHAVVEYARALPGISWVQLSVSTAAPAAQRLYERAGFEVWGSEPDALRHDDEAAGEHHMALQVTPPARAAT